MPSIFLPLQWLPSPQKHSFDALRHSKIERKRKQTRHTGEHPHTVASQIAQHPHRSPLTLLVLHQHLSASTARRRLTQLALLVPPHNGQGIIALHISPLCRCGEDGRALGTKTRGIGGVLLIVATHNRAVGQAQRCAHMEVRIWGIGTVSGFNSAAMLHALCWPSPSNCTAMS